MSTERLSSPAGRSGGSWYELDAAAFQERIEETRRRLQGAAQLCYAVKADPFLIREAEPHVERLEICSPGEWDICRRLGVPTEKAVISGVYKDPAFVRELLADPDFQGIMTVESPLQYAMIAEAARDAGRAAPVLLRVTNGSQFGMDEEQVEALLRQRDAHPELLHRGLQFFSGTQKTSAKRLSRELASLKTLLERLEEDLGYRAEEVEFGPGLPAAYFQEEPIDAEPLLEALVSGVRALPARVILELGRWLAAGCGRYYTRVVDVKRTKGQNYAIVDGGMHQVNYFGQFMAMKRPYYSVAGKESLPAEERWNVCGALCSMNDILLKDAPLPPLEVGDVLCFERTGAYSVTEGIALFLSRDLPAVYIRRADGSRALVRRALETAKWNTPEYEEEETHE